MTASFQISSPNWSTPACISACQESARKKTRQCQTKLDFQAKQGAALEICLQDTAPSPASSRPKKGAAEIDLYTDEPENPEIGHPWRIGDMRRQPPIWWMAGAAAPDSPTIEFEDLFDYVKKGVRRVTNQAQTPEEQNPNLLIPMLRRTNRESRDEP
jgi:hypothetical protein